MNDLLKQVDQPQDQSTRLIPLTPVHKGLYCTVDTSDYEWLNQWKWCAKWNPKTKTYYAGRTLHNKTILMHRLIVGAEKGDGVVDHWNNCSLDNRRINLRHCTQSQNCANVKTRVSSMSGYKGVDSNKGKWRARITVNYATVHIGYFNSAEQAARAYDKKAIEIFGSFSQLNFPIPEKPQYPEPCQPTED